MSSILNMLNIATYLHIYNLLITNFHMFLLKTFDSSWAVSHSRNVGRDIIKLASRSMT